MNRLTIDAVELAELLGVSSAFIRRKAKDGTIPHLRLGAKYLFESQAIEQIIDRFRVAPRTEQAGPR